LACGWKRSAADLRLDQPLHSCLLMALFQALGVGFVAAVLFVTVEKFEPNRLYAYLFMFLIIALGTLAILNQMVP
jgi:hypothetical protein